MWSCRASSSIFSIYTYNMWYVYVYGEREREKERDRKYTLFWPHLYRTTRIFGIKVRLKFSTHNLCTLVTSQIDWNPSRNGNRSKFMPKSIIYILYRITHFDQSNFFSRNFGFIFRHIALLNYKETTNKWLLSSIQLLMKWYRLFELSKKYIFSPKMCYFLLNARKGYRCPYVCSVWEISIPNIIPFLLSILHSFGHLFCL